MRFPNRGWKSHSVIPSITLLTLKMPLMDAIALGILGVLFVTALGFVWWEKRQLAEAKQPLTRRRMIFL